MLSTTNRLVHLTLCFGAGILLTTYQPLPWGFLFFVIVAVTVMVAANRYLFWRKSAYFLLTLFFLLGAARQQIVLEQMHKAEEFLVNRDLRVLGVVKQEPTDREGVLEFVFQPEGTNGKLLVKVPEYNFVPAYGEIVLVSGFVEKPSLPTNPGQFNYRVYCKKQGIVGIIRKGQINEPEKNRFSAEGLIFRWALLLKAKAKEVLERSFTQEDFPIVEGLIFGDTKSLNADFKNDLQKSGLIHVLSVSGFHVGLVMAGVYLLLKWLGREKKKSGLMTISIVLLLYAMMTGLRPSVIRAGLMAFLPLVGVLAGRKGRWVNTLALAILILLFVNPANLYTPGTQLSVGATWGILYLVRPVKKGLEFLPVALRDSVAVIIAAQLGTLPLLAYHFNYISLVTIATNILGVPLVTIVVFLSFFTIFLGSLFSLAGVFIASSASLVLLGLKYLVWFTAQFKSAVLNITAPSLWQVGVYYLLLFMLGQIYWNDSLHLRIKWLWKRNRRKLITGFLVFSVTLVWLGIINPSSELNVTFLDVGQGDCSVIVAPDKKVVVIDTGGASDPRQKFDPGRSILVPYLRSMGVSKVDLLAITHFHQDHIGGIKSLLREFPVDKVFISTGSNTKELPELNTLFNQNGSQLFEAVPYKPIKVDKNLSLEVIGPVSPFKGTSSDENNNSLMIKLTYGQVSYLFTGDVEAEALEYYVAQQSTEGATPEGLKASILKIPHHGSKGSLDEMFYEKVSPGAAVISVGPNFFGHPDKKVLEALAAKGIPVYRTDKEGAIITLTDGEQLTVSSFGKEDH